MASFQVGSFFQGVLSRRAYKDLYDDPFVINVPARGIKAKTLYQMVYRKLM